MYCTVQRGNVWVLQVLEGYCVCTAQSRDVLCVLHSSERYFVCNAQSREVLYVYCTV